MMVMQMDCVTDRKVYAPVLVSKILPFYLSIAQHN